MRAAAATMLLALAPHLAWAQPTPAKPVRLVVPFAAGSQADVVARLLAEKLQTALAHPIAIENRPGVSAEAAALPER